MEKVDCLVVGEWVTHIDFGIGQVEGIDVKSISGSESRYYRIKTADSTYWLPVENVDTDKLRELATPSEIQQTVETLQAPPKPLGQTPAVRQNKIKKARLKNTLQDMARIVRDLHALRQKKGTLAVKEGSAYKLLKKRIVEEWALVMKKKPETVNNRLESLLTSG